MIVCSVFELPGNQPAPASASIKPVPASAIASTTAVAPAPAQATSKPADEEESPQQAQAVAAPAVAAPADAAPAVAPAKARGVKSEVHADTNPPSNSLDAPRRARTARPTSQLMANMFKKTMLDTFKSAAEKAAATATKPAGTAPKPAAAAADKKPTTADNKPTTASATAATASTSAAADTPATGQGQSSGSVWQRLQQQPADTQQQQRQHQQLQQQQQQQALSVHQRLGRGKSTESISTQGGEGAKLPAPSGAKQSGATLGSSVFNRLGGNGSQQPTQADGLLDVSPVATAATTSRASRPSVFDRLQHDSSGSVLSRLDGSSVHAQTQQQQQQQPQPQQQQLNTAERPAKVPRATAASATAPKLSHQRLLQSAVTAATAPGGAAVVNSKDRDGGNVTEVSKSVDGGANGVVAAASSRPAVKQAVAADAVAGGGADTTNGKSKVNGSASKPPANGAQQEDAALAAMRKRVLEMEANLNRLKQQKAVKKPRTTQSTAAVATPPAAAVAGKAAVAKAAVQQEDMSLDDWQQQQQQLDIDKRSIVVANVHYYATSEVVAAHFSGRGIINRVTIKHDWRTGQPTGLAYVEFGEQAAVAKALLLNGSALLMRQIQVGQL